MRNVFRPRIAPVAKKILSLVQPCNSLDRCRPMQGNSRPTSLAVLARCCNSMAISRSRRSARISPVVPESPPCHSARQPRQLPADRPWPAKRGNFRIRLSKNLGHQFAAIAPLLPPRRTNNGLPYSIHPVTIASKKSDSKNCTRHGRAPGRLRKMAAPGVLRVLAIWKLEPQQRGAPHFPLLV